MKPATVKILRQFLQLSIEEIAEITGKPIYEVAAWEHPDPEYYSPIPPEVQQWLQNCLKVVTKIGKKYIEDFEYVKNLNNSKTPEEINLTYYETEQIEGAAIPFSKLHNVAQGYILSHLIEETTVKVEYMQPELTTVA